MKADEFKVGDVVWDAVYGWGVVVELLKEMTYCVMVKFKKHGATYTKDGKVFSEVNRTLFFEEIKIPESAYKRPRWRAEKLDFYYYIDTIGKTRSTAEAQDECDDTRFKLGNYFKTEEEAKESKFYKVFHEEE